MDPNVTGGRVQGRENTDNYLPNDANGITRRFSPRIAGMIIYHFYN